MKKYLITLTASIGLFNLLDAQTAQFPYSNSLQSSTTFTRIGGSTENIIPVNATVANVATKGVLLTDANQYKFNGIELNNINFDTNRGFNIDFEYFQWGGTNQADGLALVLFDGSTTNPTMGAKGAGLGYTYNKTTGTDVNGFSNGYLAFGFDTFGNFHKVRRQSDEIRNGLYSYSSGDTQVYDGKTESNFTNLAYDGTDGVNSSYFTIRGSAHNPKWLQANPSTATSDISRGYPLLYTVNTKFTSNGNASTGVTNGASLAANGLGGHGTRKIATFANPFHIRGGAYTNDISNAAYRKAHLLFRKGIREYYNSDNTTINETLTSYFVDVVIETNAGKQIIAKNEQFRIKAAVTPSNAIRKYLDPRTDVTSTPSAISNYDVLDYRGEAPAKLKMAFTASTGLYTQNQLVRNVNIALPYAPIVTNKSVQNICPNVLSKLNTPLKDDVAYNDDLYIERYVGTPQTAAASLVVHPNGHSISTPSANYIDVASFAFMTINSSGQYAKVSPNQHIQTIPGVGTLQYIYQANGVNLAPADVYINFMPIPGVTQLNSEFNVYYTIKNKPITGTNGAILGDEEYRSSLGTITVKTSNSNCGKPYIITNKNVSTTL